MSTLLAKVAKHEPQHVQAVSAYLLKDLGLKAVGGEEHKKQLQLKSPANQSSRTSSGVVIAGTYSSQDDDGRPALYSSDMHLAQTLRAA